MSNVELQQVIMLLFIQCIFFYSLDIDVDVVDLRAQADASMPASNNNVNYTI